MCDPQPLFLSTEALAWRYGIALPALPARPGTYTAARQRRLLKALQLRSVYLHIGYYEYAPLYGFQSRT